MPNTMNDAFEKIGPVGGVEEGRIRPKNEGKKEKQAGDVEARYTETHKHKVTHKGARNSLAPFFFIFDN